MIDDLDCNFKLKFINHASVLVRYGNIGLLSDPWYNGAAFHNGWRLLHELPVADVKNVLDYTTHIWVSHEHPDHFSVPFFSKYKEIINEKKIKILFQRTYDKRVVNFLKKLSFEVVELDFNIPYALSTEVDVTCFKDGFYDSAIFVKCGEIKVLNLNDCEIRSKRRAQEIKKYTGDIDILLTQFSYAAWKGNPENVHWREAAANEKIETMRLQIEEFQPKYVIPFASFVYFSNSRNQYLNDACNTPKKVLDSMVDYHNNIIVMRPMDYLHDAVKNVQKAVKFWERKYNLIDRTIDKYESVPFDQLSSEFNTYVKRIEDNNNLKLMKFTRYLSPIKVFRPVVILLDDLQCTVRIDIIHKTIQKVELPPQLQMSSESLKFLFSNSFGFDTLTVNGCFKETNRGGFSLATRTLAIENFNNLGFSWQLKTLLQIRLFVVFMSRLYRVARKLES